MSYIPLADLGLSDHLAAERVLDVLPPPGDYTANYQPHYPDNGALLDAVEELHGTEAVTTPRQVDALQTELTKLAAGESDRPIIITGRCAEEVNLGTPIETLVSMAVLEYQLVLSALPNAIVIQRNRGQNFKPRSAATEVIAGQAVASYMGDGINSSDAAHRTPDPSRLVSAAVQARDLEAGMTAMTGEHIPAAHEALSLAYEHSFVRLDAQTGNKYLASADLPWIGKRTNAIDGEHVNLLAEVANPIGIKIGPDSTPEQIAALQAKLNPSQIPGKLVFMLRMGPKNETVIVMQDIVGAIRDHAPHSVVMYDIHGVTRTAPTGQKIRYTGDIIDDIRMTATTLREHGLKLHGLHLETTPDDTRLECVDEPNQLPTHPGGVDPQLNPRQLAYVLEQTREYLL